MSRRRKFFQFSGRLGDLERYGLLALVAGLLLAVAFVAQTVAGDVAPFRTIAFRGAAERMAAARSVGDAALAEAASEPDAGTSIDEPGGGEALAPPVAGAQAASTRPAQFAGFDFYEPPVRVPGKAPVVAPPPPGTADAASSVRTVRVRRGDTLQKIATRELGAGSRWRVLLDWNPGVDPKKLQPGMELKLPVARREPKAAPAPTPRTHTVAREETLESIAERHWGDRKRWIDLLEANRDQLSAPTGLRAGMKLRIP